MTTEKEQLTWMLDRAGIGYGLRIDYDTKNTAVLVERSEGEQVTEWLFDEAGRLVSIIDCA